MEQFVQLLTLSLLITAVAHASASNVIYHDTGTLISINATT